jgi:hypothetical protein
MKKKEDEIPSSPPPSPSSLQHQDDFSQEQLTKERQQRLEESHLHDAETERILKELQNQKESTERIAAIERLLAEECVESEECVETEHLQNLERLLAEERVESERVETEHLQNLERLLAERVETEHLQNLERLLAERVEAERLLAERVEAERVEAERVEGIVENSFEQYKEQYHEFYSTRPQPIHSNFNEKMFKELCNKFTFNTIETLLTHLDDYNLIQKRNKEAYNKLSRKRKLKCDVFNFYLFIDCNHHKN